MNLEQAIEHTRTCAQQMDERYKKVVFDEWAIVSLAGHKRRMLAYTGPRKEDFQKNFFVDAGSLRTGLLIQGHHPGDFDFSRHGVGTGFEAFMALGNGMYLICNNTVQSMDGITRDPRWFAAQVPFVELSDRFREDELVLNR
jgi:hypothetical protein